MKKLFIAALIVVAAGTSAFAADGKKENYKVRNNFESQFAGAQDVSWIAKENYLKVSFTMMDEKVEAFYGTDGDLIGVSRKIDMKALPLNAIRKIRKEYASFKVTDTIEFDQDGDKSYYVSLEDGNRKQILQVSLYGSVSIYKGEAK
jgi:hypothetical protein